MLFHGPAVERRDWLGVVGFRPPDKGRPRSNTQLENRVEANKTNTH